MPLLPMKPLLFCAAFLAGLSSFLGATPLGPVRAAYQFPTGKAYSASVDLPLYHLVDLGPSLTPLAINDALTVLLRSEANELIRWSAGRREVLLAPFPSGAWAGLNEAGAVVTRAPSVWPTFEILFWPEHSSTPVTIPWGQHLSAPLVSLQLFALNDQNQLVLRSQSETMPIGIPPYRVLLTTDLLNLESGHLQELARYDYLLNPDFSLSQGGQVYTVNSLNNYGRTAGSVYEDQGYSPPFSNEFVFLYQHEYFALDRDSALDFEPLALNDAGTVLGVTEGPLFDFVVQDQFGQRFIGSRLEAVEPPFPKMSNPVDGMEEIVFRHRYWKRMSERDFSGRPTGQPSPDFWEGTLEDIVANPQNWSDLKATCISAHGRIAGTGRFRNPATGDIASHAFLLLPEVVLPDWDRNGRIEEADRQQARARQPWRFWINDDDDAGDLARSPADDLPEGQNPDALNPGIDGLRDAVDFFPVFLDLQTLLRALPGLGQVEVSLHHAEEALNFVYTRLRPDEVRRPFTEAQNTGYGPGFDQPLGEAVTHRVTQAGVPLSQAFLQQLRDENRGILLVEGRAATTAPLLVRVRWMGTEAFTCSLPLSLSRVHSMFRVLNLRRSDPKFATAELGPWPTRLEDPENLPDASLQALGYPLRTLVHLHGFNWSGEEVPAAHAEVFKRFFQLGSQARFIGVTWFGNEGTLDLFGTSLDYNENVINAFVSAGHLASSLAGFAGPFTSLFAHSLGNLLASSAVVDHGLDIAHLFMVNAAVPAEAYLGEQPDRRLMVHPDWKDTGGLIADYSEHLLAANWARLFSPDDRRSRLTWKDRFAALPGLTFCHNFYSSGEDILRPGNGDVPRLFQDIWDRELIWVYNEMNKGRTSPVTSLMGEIHGGWGFNRHYMTWRDPGGPSRPPPGKWIPMPSLQADSVPAPALVAEPFFGRFSSGDDAFPLWLNGSWLYADGSTANAYLPGHPFTGMEPDAVKNHAKVLAEAIPAHSAPAGARPLPLLPLLKNVDLDEAVRSDTFWPARPHPDKRDRWLHGDYLAPALSYVSGLFESCIHYINTKP